MNEPRLIAAIGLWAVAIIAGGIASMIKDNQGIGGGMRLILYAFAVVFAVLAVIQTLDIAAYRTGQRMREINAARVLHVTQVANAIERLTTGRQLELVEAMGLTTMSLVPGDQEPILFVDVPGGRVPHEAVQDFLRQSVETYPALLPIRRGGQPWREAAMITAMLIAHGWAEKGSGPHTARLVVPLKDVAVRLWVDLDISELEE